MRRISGTIVYSDFCTSIHYQWTFYHKVQRGKSGKRADNSLWITANGSRVTFRPLPCMFWNIPLDEQHDFLRTHGDVIKWKHFPRYWPFVRGIHRSPVNSPHKGQWRRALIFSLICVWNDWVNKREAGDLRRYRAHYDVIVMISSLCIANGRTGSSYFSVWNISVKVCHCIMM